MRTKEQTSAIIKALEDLYPEADCSLNYKKDYELLFSARLSAQCTDERVNKITPELFALHPTLESIAGADVRDIERIIHSCGFFRAKARDIVSCAGVLLERFGGSVPGTMEELLTLPGVGRKTANLILGDVFGLPAVVADTHCIRLSGRIGFVDGSVKDPVKVESALREILPPEKSSRFCHALVLHGRAVCMARSPKCADCRIAPHCRYYTGD